MDRRIRNGLSGAAALLAGGLLLCSTGCRSTKSEVPAGKPYQTTGAPPPSVGFSQEPHPSTAAGMAGLYNNQGPGAGVQDGKYPTGNSSATVYGTPTPGTSLGVPTDNQYGPPGTAGMAGTSGAALAGPAPGANFLPGAQPTGTRDLARDPGSTSTLPGRNGGPGGTYP